MENQAERNVEIVQTAIEDSLVYANDWSFEAEDMLKEIIGRKRELCIFKPLKDIYVGEAYLRPVSINAYNHPSGLNGRIIGMVYATPKYRDKRLCYILQWPDDSVDYVAISDVKEGAYEFTDIKETWKHETKS
jgi:hypothetical protein